MVLAVLIASIVMLTAKKGGTVEVYVDGKLTYSYALDKNRIFEVDCDNGKNVVEIKDGKVSVIDADCHNRACVKSNAISKKRRANRMPAT
ncbi:MAG: NusG domain II-containing protein [Clostridium sp.]|nr:MAG: NusG domain II-containing protein [Clostridium sp.]